MMRAPYTHDFSVKPFMTRAWFAIGHRPAMAEAVLSFQAPNGGWSKHVDFTQHPRRRARATSPRAPSGSGSRRSTTTRRPRRSTFSSLADGAQHDERYAASISRGVDYLLASQYPNGCFPQIYPLEGSYHDAVTFNDNAIVNVLRLLRDVASGAYRYPTAMQRERAAAAVNARHRVHSAHAGHGQRRAHRLGPTARSPDARADERAQL